MLSKINWKKTFSYFFVALGWCCAIFVALTVGRSDGVHIRDEAIEKFLNNPSIHNLDLIFPFLFASLLFAAPVIFLGYAAWALGGLPSGKRLFYIGFILMAISMIFHFFPSTV